MDEFEAVFPGDSQLSRLMRQHDWAATTLGPVAAWPEGLKVALQMMLSSRFEMWLGWGPDLLFFYNDAYVPTLGAKHPAALGRPFREVWKEVYADVAEQVESVRAGRPTWNKALLLLLERSALPGAPAEETYHTFSYSPLRGDGGSIQGLMCVVSEETERVISERRLQTLQSLADGLLHVRSPEQVLARVDATLGLQRKDFPFCLVYLRDRDGSWKGHAATADAQALLGCAWPLEPGASSQVVPLAQVVDAAVTLPTGAWTLAPRECLIVPLAGADRAYGALVLGFNPYRRNDPDITGFAKLVAGQISSALASINMLETERRRAERLWEHSRDLLLVVDDQGRIQSVSPSWSRMLGHTPEQVVGRLFFDFVHADDLAATYAALEHALHRGEILAFENRYVTRSGEARWISWHTTLDAGFIYGYGRDVSEEKAQAAALATAEEALRQAQKMEAIGQLTGGIAHDFNNLLTGILGSLEMVQRRSAQGRLGEAERYIGAATASANRAASLTQRLLAFSRRQSLDPRPVDPDRLIRDMEDLLRRSIGESIRLEIVRSAGLWRTRCDPHQLDNAVLNLAINARDAMPEGGRLTIESSNVSIDAEYAADNRQARPGQYVCISVSDTGTGMSADVIAHAFEPFFTTKPIGTGTGLGLSMIYGFARQSEGFVNLYSEVGQGSTVRLYLPRHYGEGDASVAAAAPEPDQPENTGDVILLVEDEAVVRSLVVEVLEDLGFRVLQAADGPAGLELLRSPARIDLMVTDVGLPGMNGRQLADAARQLRPELRVLFMTGYAHNAAVGNGLLDPGMQIITKPFSIEKFVTRIRRMLEVSENLRT